MYVGGVNQFCRICLECHGIPSSIITPETVTERTILETIALKLQVNASLRHISIVVFHHSKTLNLQTVPIAAFSINILVVGSMFIIQLYFDIESSYTGISASQALHTSLPYAAPFSQYFLINQCP